MEIIVVAVAAAALLILRGPLAALLPVALAAPAWYVSVALVHLDQNMRTVLAAVLLSLACGHVLTLLSRFRERLRIGDDRARAAGEAIRRARTSLVGTEIVLVVGSGALALANTPALAALGVALAVGVALLSLVCLTVLPLALHHLGTAVFWPAKPWRRGGRRPAATRLSNQVAARPVTVALASAVLLAGLGAPALVTHADYDAGSTTLHASLRGADGAVPTGAELTGFAARLRLIDGVGEIVPSGDRIELRLAPRPGTDVLDLINGPIRVEAARAAPDGTEAVVDGTAVRLAELRTATGDDLTTLLPLVALLVLLTLGFILRGMVVALLTGAAVLLGAGASLGVTSLIGGLTLPWPLPAVVLILSAAVGVGWTVLMVTRVREGVGAGLEQRTASALAVRYTAGPVVAGLLLTTVAAVSLAAGVPAFEGYGLAVAAGVFLPTAVVTTLLVPALVALSGRSVRARLAGGTRPWRDTGPAASGASGVLRRPRLSSAG
ncbi:MMPL family transporter [Rhizohabitans arisaemae]|uniref:MMPL family transporter n=1 Tax=Rhizohabitans arisaemae TaxID=2720610 RepID=UPI0024B18878|nr:MMPL family transporter [Rhizohabitans arisaemae]